MRFFLTILNFRNAAKNLSLDLYGFLLLGSNLGHGNNQLRWNHHSRHGVRHIRNCSASHQQFSQSNHLFGPYRKNDKESVVIPAPSEPKFLHNELVKAWKADVTSGNPGNEAETIIFKLIEHEL